VVVKEGELVKVALRSNVSRSSIAFLVIISEAGLDKGSKRGKPMSIRSC
jgi:hypothetical protein